MHLTPKDFLQRQQIRYDGLPVLNMIQLEELQNRLWRITTRYCIHTMRMATYNINTARQACP